VLDESKRMPYLNDMRIHGFADAAAARDKGRELATVYNVAAPFPHIVIDDFLPPIILERCLDLFPSRNATDTQFDRAQERYKVQYNPDTLPDELRTLFYTFNARPFIRVIENITGIKGLIPDPYFLGAGFHETATGGHLSIHADFNHHKPMNLERRINLLIYLNKEWQADYGGELELWDQGMQQKVVNTVPLFNRCVIFNTGSDTYHGNPKPVNHPQGLPRRSIALYYYTATWIGPKRDRTTQFQIRTGTTDRVDWRVKSRELVVDLLPPLLQRTLARARNRAKVTAD
jgi:hypothetical protein